jgi:hypothetical protein
MIHYMPGDRVCYHNDLDDIFGTVECVEDMGWVRVYWDDGIDGLMNPIDIYLVERNS